MINVRATRRLLPPRSPPQDSQPYDKEPSVNTTQGPAYQSIPSINVLDPDQNRLPLPKSDSSSTETEANMSSSHRSHHHSSSSKGKASSSSSSSSRSKSKKDDWSDITDPEERRRVQNRIAQRKFRDKAKEAKERHDRDAENRAHAGHAYHTPDPRDMGTDDELSGLPWGSLSLKHVVSTGKAKEAASRRSSSRRDDATSYYGGGASRDVSYSDSPTYGESPVEGGGYYAGGEAASSAAYFEPAGDYAYEEERTYYDYGSGSGSRGGSSR